MTPVFSSPAGRIDVAALSDVVELAANMRPEDVRELRATTPEGTSVEAVLGYNIGVSRRAYTVRTSDGRLMACLGVAPDGRGNGAVWMHGTTAMDARPRAFARHTRMVKGWLHSEYSVLWNWADTRNSVHLRWLGWAGFVFLEKSTAPSNDGTEFIKFISVR